MKSVEFWLCLARVWLVSLGWGGFLTFYGRLGASNHYLSRAVAGDGGLFLCDMPK